MSADPDPDGLAERWAAVRERSPDLRIRYAAAGLGVSEAQLLATRTGAGVRRLRADAPALLQGLEAVGPCMALTRNDLFVHEKTGVYRNVYLDPHVISVAADAIDLRVFPARWRHAFAVEDEGPRGRRRSLQVFDAHGDAVHKVFPRDQADGGALDALVDALATGDPSRELAVEPRAPAADAAPDGGVDVAALEAGWRAMRNTHDFHGLLRGHGVGRVQALRLVDDALARPASGGGLRRVLETASTDAIPIMVFVNSPGTIQIHHGPVERIVDTEGWLNVLDPGFQLHAREGEVGSTWVVAKPTEAGWVTSVEIYDAEGGLAALFFGVRAEGREEDPAWRALARGLDAPTSA